MGGLDDALHCRRPSEDVLLTPTLAPPTTPTSQASSSSGAEPFSIPKKPSDGDFAIPKRAASSSSSSFDPYGPQGQLLHASTGSFDSLHSGSGSYPPPPEAPPVPGGAAKEEDPFPFVPGCSLDRARFDPQFLVWGMAQGGEGGQQGGLRGWDSREAEAPLVIPLPEFGCVDVCVCVGVRERWKSID